MGMSKTKTPHSGETNSFQLPPETLIMHQDHIGEGATHTLNMHDLPQSVKLAVLSYRPSSTHPNHL